MILNKIKFHEFVNQIWLASQGLWPAITQVVLVHPMNFYYTNRTLWWFHGLSLSSLVGSHNQIVYLQDKEASGLVIRTTPNPVPLFYKKLVNGFVNTWNPHLFWSRINGLVGQSKPSKPIVPKNEIMGKQIFKNPAHQYFLFLIPGRPGCLTPGRYAWWPIAYHL